MQVVNSPTAELSRFALLPVQLFHDGGGVLGALHLHQGHRGLLPRRFLFGSSQKQLPSHVALSSLLDRHMFDRHVNLRVRVLLSSARNATQTKLSTQLGTVLVAVEVTKDCNTARRPLQQMRERETDT
jgi:hypothetical protein